MNIQILYQNKKNNYSIPNTFICGTDMVVNKYYNFQHNKIHSVILNFPKNNLSRLNNDIVQSLFILNICKDNNL